MLTTNRGGGWGGVGDRQSCDWASDVAGVIKRVGDDRIVDEHEEGQVGQEVEQVQGGNVLQLPSDGGLLFQVDPTSLQLQEQLLSADEAPLNTNILLLFLQEKQEQLLHESRY